MNALAAGHDADSRRLFGDPESQCNPINGEPGCPTLMTYGCIRRGAPFLVLLSGVTTDKGRFWRGIAMTDAAAMRK